MLRISLVVLLGIVLCGCSPDYNWREVTLNDGAGTAYFPDKPKTQKRDMQFEGHTIVFALTSVAVDDVLFSVGHAILPEAFRQDAAARQRFAQAVLASLYQNLGHTPPTTLPDDGQSFVVEGRSAHGPVRLQAALWLTDRVLVEGLVTADTQDFPAAPAQEFLRGITPAR